MEQKKPARTRTKTRCHTCRIRKVRCDERRPACQRCTSTGRKCDGYEDEISSSISCHYPFPKPSSNQSATLQAPTVIPRQLKVALPRKNVQEMRSYRFFLDVTAPSIAGVYDADFWLSQVPQTRHLNIAVWHAVVALGAVHENCLDNPHQISCSGLMELFALKQLNLSIHQLVRPFNSLSDVTKKWQALIVGIILAYLCNLQGQYLQSKTHLAAANRLLKELDTKRDTKCSTEACEPLSTTLPIQPKSTSIPYESLWSALIRLDINSKSLQSPVSDGETTFMSESSSRLIWKHYKAPSLCKGTTVCQHGKAVPSRATTANLNHAGRAMGSLLYHIIALGRQNTRDQARLVLGRDFRLLKTLIHHQEPLSHAFRQLSMTLDSFIKDTTITCCCFQDMDQYPLPTQQQRRAIDVLKLYHGVCYTMFLEKPHQVDLLHAMHDMQSTRDTVDSVKDRQDKFLELDPNPESVPLTNFSRTLDLAESILRDERVGVRTANAADLTPILPITMPLFIMAHVGWITAELRRRIIRILRQYPRRDLFMDSRFAAALVEFILNEEMQGDVATVEGQQAPAGTMPPLANQPMDDLPLESRVCCATVDFKEGRAATITLETWDHWLNQRPGRKAKLTW